MGEFGTLLFDAQSHSVHMKEYDIDFRRSRAFCGKLIIKAYANTIGIDNAINLICKKCTKKYINWTISNDYRFYKGICHDQLESNLSFASCFGKTKQQQSFIKNVQCNFNLNFLKKNNKYDPINKTKIYKSKKFYFK